jgi:hypothetical protein
VGVPLIALKLMLTPSLIAGVTLAQRRWGATAVATIAGVVAAGGFCVVYARNGAPARATFALMPALLPMCATLIGAPASAGDGAST